MRGLLIPPALIRVVSRLALRPPRPPVFPPHCRGLASLSAARHPASPLAEMVAQQMEAKEFLSAPVPPQPSATPPSPAPQYPPLHNRYHRVSWRFQAPAQSHSIQTALTSLETEGRALFHQRRLDAAAQHQRTLATLHQHDDDMRRQGKIPPPRATSSPPDPNDAGTALDWLACHPSGVYLQLMRAFASYGDVDGCYSLLQRLYQVAMHTQSLTDVSSQPTRKPPARPPRPSPPQRRGNREREAPTAAKEEPKVKAAVPAPSIFTNELLAAIMTAYAASSTACPSTHHHQLFNHYSMLRLSPNAEFYHSLLLYHAHRQSVQSYITAMSALSRSRHPPDVDEYIRAIRYFGLHCRDQDAALQLFLHLSSLALPNATAFNSLIAVFGERGDWMMAYRLMTDMERQGQRPSAWTYASLIRALLLDGRELVALQLHRWAAQWKRREVEARKEPWRDNCYAVLLDHYAQRQDTAQLLSTWRDMRRDRMRPERNSYTAVLRGLLHAGRGDEARVVVEEMVGRRGLVWDFPAYDVALQVVAAQRDLPAVQRLYAAMKAFMRGKGIAVPARLFATVVSAFPTTAPANAASSSTPLSLCLQLLAVLREHREHGVEPSAALLTTLLGLLRAYGAQDAAQLLEERKGAREGERWSADVLEQAKQAVVRGLKEGGDGGAEGALAAHRAESPATAELRA